MCFVITICNELDDTEALLVTAGTDVYVCVCVYMCAFQLACLLFRIGIAKTGYVLAVPELLDFSRYGMDSSSSFLYKKTFM